MLAASLDMFPGNTSAQIGYMTLGDRKVAGDVHLPFACGITPTNFENLLCGQHCGRVSFALLARLIGAFCLAALCHHVSNVVQVCAEKQVVRVAAKSIVAAVQYVEIVRDWAIGNFPGDSVSRMRVAVNGERAVAVAANAGCPIPAVVRAKLDNSFPESPRDRLSTVVSGDVATTLARSSIKGYCLPAAASAKRWLRRRWLFSSLMTINVLNWLTSYPATPLIRDAGAVSLRPAAAHAQTAWVWLFQWRRNVPAVAAKVEQRFARLPSASGVGIRGKISLLSATAMAIAIGDFVRGFVCGMLRHAEFSLVELGLAVGRSYRRHGFCIGTYSCKYTTFIPHLKEYAPGGLHE